MVYKQMTKRHLERLERAIKALQKERQLSRELWTAIEEIAHLMSVAITEMRHERRTKKRRK